MKPEDLGKMDFSCRYELYTALLNMVKSDAGTGFHNHDKGHPAYTIGASDGSYDLQVWGDSPEHSHLYQMMKALSDSLADCGDFRHDERVTDWQSFCRLALCSHEEHCRI